jgi:hypothetical protein
MDWLTDEDIEVLKARKSIAKKPRAKAPSKQLKKVHKPKVEVDIQVEAVADKKAAAGYTGVLLKTNGKWQYEKGFKLPAMQKMVGGYIEAVDIAPCTYLGVRVNVAVVNEEGLLANLPINTLARGFTPEDEPLYGPVLLTSRKYM